MAKDKAPDTKGTAPDTPNYEEALRPFQEAGNSLLQTTYAAQEAANKQRTLAYLDYQDQVRQIEQEAYKATAAATRKYVSQGGSQSGGDPEKALAARAKAQSDYEEEIRKIQTDAQKKYAEVTQKAAEKLGKDDDSQQQTQAAFQKYLGDLQTAWSSTKAAPDPQTLNAIAAHIYTTITAVSQG